MIDIEKIKSLEKCKKFTFVDPTDFIDLFKNKNFEVVEVYYPFKYNGELDITFAGEFKWENNIISSLDGDEYNDHMNVIAYEVFSHEDKIYLGVISDFPWR